MSRNVRNNRKNVSQSNNGRKLRSSGRQLEDNEITKPDYKEIVLPDPLNIDSKPVKNKKPKKRKETAAERKFRINRIKLNRQMRIAKETPEQKEERLRNEKTSSWLRYKVRSAKETPEKRAARLERQRIKDKERRANETAEQRAIRLEKGRKHVAAIYKYKKLVELVEPEKKEARLERIRNTRRLRTLRDTSEERQRVQRENEQRRIRCRIRRSMETADERQIRLAKQREKDRVRREEKRANETSEEKEARMKKHREYVRAKWQQKRRRVLEHTDTTTSTSFSKDDTEVMSTNDHQNIDWDDITITSINKEASLESENIKEEHQYEDNFTSIKSESEVIEKLDSHQDPATIDPTPSNPVNNKKKKKTGRPRTKPDRPETDEEKKARIKYISDRRKQRIANETPAEREKRIRHERSLSWIRYKIRSAQETPEKRQARLDRQRDMDHYRRANETPEQRAARLEKVRKYMNDLNKCKELDDLTNPDKREARLERMKKRTIAKRPKKMQVVQNIIRKEEDVVKQTLDDREAQIQNWEYGIFKFEDGIYQN